MRSARAARAEAEARDGRSTGSATRRLPAHVTGRRVAPLTRRGRSVPGGRLRQAGRAALLCLAALVAACGPSGPATRPPDGSPAGTTPPATGSARPGAGGSASPSIAPAERLAGALTALQAGYTFDTTVTVGGQIAARVRGRRLGGASELVIESGGSSVTYRIVPPRSWVLEQGSEWAALEGTVAGGDPLAPLLEPQGLELVATSGETLQVRATYPASALGLPGSDPVAVMMTVAPGDTVTARYATEVNGSEAISETVLEPATTQDPIVAPSTRPSSGGG